MKKATAIRLIALVVAILMLTGMLAGCDLIGFFPELPGLPDLSDGPEATTGDQPDSGLRYDPLDPLSLSELSDRQKMKPTLSRGDAQVSEKPYTIMVYMVGSNLESQGGAASRDLVEMLNSGLDPANCNVLIYTGGSSAWQCGIPSSCNVVWSLKNDMSDVQVEAATDAPVNTGDPATLVDFLNFGYENFPAEHYGLIMWDHGGGPLGGFGSDELFQGDGLNLYELQLAMEASPFAREKLDFVGFDACLMASIEIADLFDEYADYLIASEELEPGSGWDYSFLEILNRTTDTQQLAKHILSTYESSLAGGLWKTEYTLSCMDLSQVAATTEAMNALFDAMRTQVVTGQFSTVAKARENTKAFALSAVANRTDALDLVDLADMAEQVRSSCASEALALLTQLEKLVVDNVTNLDHANGVTVYYPYENKSTFQQAISFIMELFPTGEGHKQFLEQFCDVWINGEPVMETPAAAPVTQEEYISFQLTQEQMENLSAAYYTLFVYEKDAIDQAVYSPVLLDVRVTPDKDGVLRIPRDPEVFLMKSDTNDEGIVYTARQVETTDSKDNYVSVGGAVFGIADITAGSENIQFYLSEDLSSGDVDIQAIYQTSYTGAGTYGKTEVNLDHWGMVGRNMFFRYPTYDENSWLLPYEQWQTSGWIMYQLLSYDQEIWLEKANISSLNTDMFCQIMLKDTMGNTYGTTLVELPAANAPETLELAVPGGTLLFSVLDSEATLTGSTGEITQLDIPAQVEGIPVTGIGYEAFQNSSLTQVSIPGSVKQIAGSAFSSNYDLQTVVLSEGLEAIGPSAFSYSGITQIALPASLREIRYNAFSGCDLQTVQIPAGVTRIDTGAFSNCESLTQLSVAPGNSAYKSVDGVLFTADGKTLLQFPAGKQGSYAIPTGTVTIADSAFEGASGLTHVDFNNGLQHIGIQAFNGVFDLDSLQLPDSLLTVGNSAFSGFHFDFSFGDEPVTTPATTVYIGKNVEWIGYNAFDGYDLEAFQVSSSNQHFSSQNGLLLNKNGTCLIEVPVAFQGTLNIPGTISRIGEGALDDCDGITELILPDSVASIDLSAGVPKDLQKISIGAGLVDWGNVHYFADVETISISSNNIAYHLIDESIYSKDGTKLLLARTDESSYTVKEGVITIAANAFGGLFSESCANVKVLELPASLAEFPAGAFSSMPSLEEIRISGSNFSARSGMLYSNDGTTLHAVPAAITGTLNIPSGTKIIAAKAVPNGLMAEKIVLPEGVVAIRNGNFVNDNFDIDYEQHLYLPDSLTDIYPEMLKSVDNIVVHCSAGSEADKFCKNLEITVIND